MRSHNSPICGSVEGQLNHFGSGTAQIDRSNILQVVYVGQSMGAGGLAESELFIFHRSHILAIEADGLIASRAVAQIANVKWLALQGVFCSNSARSQNCGKETNGKGHKLYYKFTNLI